MRRIHLTLVIALLTSDASVAQVPMRDRDGLEDIVGTWQSDTAHGVSALSTCRRSPQQRAVICEQTITTPLGVRSAVNVFLVDSARRRYAYYGISRPGEDTPAVPLQILDHIWTYGGRGKAEDSLYHRTVNDFSVKGAYVWRQESSPDAIHWTVQRQGRAVLIVGSRSEARSPSRRNTGTVPH